MSQLFMRRPNLGGLPALLPPAGLLVREYLPGDGPKLAALLSEAFEDGSWTDQRVSASLVWPPDVKHVLVVEDTASGDGTLAATASAHLLPEAYAGSGYVHWVG